MKHATWTPNFIVSILCLAVVALAFLTGCGGGDPEDQDPEVQYVPPNGPPSVICTPSDSGFNDPQCMQYAPSSLIRAR